MDSKVSEKSAGKRQAVTAVPIRPISVASIAFALVPFDALFRRKFRVTDAWRAAKDDALASGSERLRVSDRARPCLAVLGVAFDGFCCKACP